MSDAATLPKAEAPTAPLLDVRAVARLLGCSPRHVYRLADSGRMPPPLRIGVLVRWRLNGPGGLCGWLDSGCPGGPTWSDIRAFDDRHGGRVVN